MVASCIISSLSQRVNSNTEKDPKMHAEYKSRAKQTQCMYLLSVKVLNCQQNVSHIGSYGTDIDTNLNQQHVSTKMLLHIYWVIVNIIYYLSTSNLSNYSDELTLWISMNKFEKQSYICNSESYQ